MQLISFLELGNERLRPWFFIVNKHSLFYLPIQTAGFTFLIGLLTCLNSNGVIFTYETWVCKKIPELSGNRPL